MSKESSRELCRSIFRAEAAAGRKFYAVNKRYPVLLRKPTADDLAHGIETQESTSSRVKPTQLIIIRCTLDGEPVMISTKDGRTVPDQWASGIDKIGQNFDYEAEPTAEGQTVRATRKPGRPCAYVKLSEPVTTEHARGEETWPAGNYMSCWNEETMDDFTSISAVSFDDMKEPADAQSAAVFAKL